MENAAYDNQEINQPTKDANLRAIYTRDSLGKGQGGAVKVKPDEDENQGVAVKVRPDDGEGQAAAVKGWRAALYDFTQQTTLHGVHNITEPTHFNIRRLLWLLVVLLGLTLVILQVVQSVLYYLSWPVMVNMKINYNKTLTFPAVTICNQNDFKTTEAARAGLYQLVQEYYSNLQDGQTDLDKYNASNIKLDFLYDHAAHSKADMVVRCEWDAKECHEEDFEEIFTDYGRCFTFNYGRSPGHALHTVQRTGAAPGLRLLLNIEQYEYMLGPNKGAGIKILTHENTEIPSVRDLGLAIPPGSHAYVGIEITKISNLKPPHGKCNDSVQLQHYKDYSVVACVEECKTNFLQEHCGCRDFYMHTGEGQHGVPVCTLAQYQNCAQYKIDEEFYQPLPDGGQRCDCPIACSRLVYDSTVSYAATSAYDTQTYKRSNITDQLEERFLAAREVLQRVDEVEHARNVRLITALNTTVWQIDELLQDLMVNLNKVKVDLDEDMRQLKKRTWFHRQWGVEKVKYMVHNNFVRGWEVLDERTFSLLTVGYQEMVAYANLIANVLKDTPSKNTTLDTHALLISANKDFFTKETICKRALDRITKVMDNYVNVKIDLVYEGSPNERYDQSWVTPGVIKVEPRSERYINKLRQRTEQFRQQNAITRNLLQQSYEGRANASEIVNDVTAAGVLFEKAARSYNYYRFLIYDRVVLKTDVAADEVMAKFDLVNQTMIDDFETIHRGLNGVLTFMGKLRLSWQFMAEVNKYADMYLKKRSNKTALAELVLSHDVTKAYQSLGSYFNEARIRAYDLNTHLKNYEMSTQKLWRNMLEEPALQPFYTKVHADVSESERNSTTLDELLETFVEMTGQTKSSIRDDIGMLYQVMNADFPITIPEDKVNEIVQLFGKWSKMVDIKASIGDLDAMFFLHFDDLSNNLKEFGDGNQINTAFFETNFLSVDVFMKDLSYQEIEQKKAYSMTGLWSNIGGSMGLFIGASVITVFEFLDVFIINCIRLHCIGRKKPHSDGQP